MHLFSFFVKRSNDWQNIHFRASVLPYYIGTNPEEAQLAIQGPKITFLSFSFFCLYFPPLILGLDVLLLVGSQFRAHR